ncbi:hypothetical protein L6475_13120 [Prevotella sp. E9-3]|uniref:hypothetical protein n=1 Tax=Prevotella sp. E9-3 TaxID=2913621 RepID=UPI001EDA0114|nr:hypothetical protein [Prevotella sp. E9-3]UKK48129.1 hypothetical protein L6475_13120 [Prevotella sp. E9-3]
MNALITLATNEMTNSAGAKTDIETAINTATTNKENCTTADALNTDYNTLETARQTYVTGAEPTNGHPFDWTFKLSNPSFESDDTGWIVNKNISGSTECKVNTAESESADGEKYYNAWASQINYIEVYQNVTLPIGNYTLKGYLYTGSGNKKAQHIYAYNGTDNPSSNLNSEKNWEQLTADFVQTSSSSVKIGVYSQGNNVNNDTKGWFRADNFQLFYNGLKPVLNDLISSATTLTTTNVGTGVFQIPSSAASTLSSAIADAQGVYDNADADGATIQTAIDNLNAAIATFGEAELNAPDEGKRYGIINVTPSSSFDYSGKALTFYVNPSQTEGGYGYKYMLDPNINYAQGFIFTPVDGEKNVYTLSFIDADGNTKYICTQYGYNENASGDKSRIRTTENETYALKIRIDITTTENVWKLYNTEAQKNIGTNGKDNNDFFTNADRSDIRIIEVNQTSVPITILSDNKFATRIFPFTSELPSGVKAYSCAATEGDVLTLEEVTEPAANTPYILYAEDGYTGDALTGYGTATADSYTTGLLTGVYTSTPAPVGSYVLQKNNDILAFYKVGEGQPTVGAYRAYLTVPNNNARALFFSFDDDNQTTAVKTIEALTSGKSEIYNTSGVRQNALQKGMNILKMEDGSIRKVMIK